jgi:hypothetical protein
VFSANVVAENKLVGEDCAGCVDESFAAIVLDFAKQTGVRVPRSEAETGFTVFDPHDERPLRIAGRRWHLNEKLELFRMITVGFHAGMSNEFGERFK